MGSKLPGNSDLGEFSPADKRYHLEGDAWRWLDRDYRLHRWVFREQLWGPFWFVAVRSWEGRSTATFWCVGWWVWQNKTTNGLPPSWETSKPKTVLKKSQLFHSGINTWWRTDKENRLHHTVFNGLVKPRDMDSNCWIKRNRSTVSVDRATLKFLVCRCVVWFDLWPSDLERENQRPPFGVHVGRVGKIKPLMVSHLHRAPSKPKMVLKKSQRFHSGSNTWRRTKKANRLHREIFSELFRPRDMDSNRQIRKRRSTVNVDQATLGFLGDFAPTWVVSWLSVCRPQFWGAELSSAGPFLVLAQFRPCLCLIFERFRWAHWVFFTPLCGSLCLWALVVICVKYFFT